MLPVNRERENENMKYLEALRQKKAAGVIPVIPDIKCFSPKEGDLMRGRDPVAFAISMEKAGAPALSVVTQEKDFRGSMELLRRICEKVRVPILRKDFVQDAADLAATKEAGASAILLMYSCLGKEKLKALFEEALRIGLTPFVETHSREELSWAGELGASLVGINNRDILRLERDDGNVSHAASLLKYAPEDAFVVVESGLSGGRDVRRAIRSGADAVLVGTAVLKAVDEETMLHAMMRPCALKVCGLMDPEGTGFCLTQQVDMLGFVTEYPVSVPWNLRREETKNLLEEVKADSVSSGIQTCVVTGGAPEQVVALAKELGPDYVQLHYTESLEELAIIADRLHESGIRVVRSISFDPALRRKMFGTATLEEVFRKIRLAGADAGLLDSRDAQNASFGGGSILSDEETKGDMGIPFFIGGGITGDNALEVYRRFRPDLIDVMTGVETAPGRKDRSLIKRLTDVLAGVEFETGESVRYTGI